MYTRDIIVRLAKKLGACPHQHKGRYVNIYDDDRELLLFIEKRLDEIITRKTPYDWKDVAIRSKEEDSVG